jgi:hypothetical protein
MRIVGSPIPGHNARVPHAGVGIFKFLLEVGAVFAKNELVTMYMAEELQI